VSFKNDLPETSMDKSGGRIGIEDLRPPLSGGSSFTVVTQGGASLDRLARRPTPLIPSSASLG